MKSSETFKKTVRRHHKEPEIIQKKIRWSISDHVENDDHITMADYHVLSKAISDVLDWIGLSHDEVQWRIKVWKQLDSVRNVVNTIIGRTLVHIAGSRAEGVGMNVLGSDTDVMFFDNSLCLISRCSDWNLLSGIYTCLVSTNDVHPGYCRLIVMHSDVPTFVNTNEIYHHLFIPHKGLLLLRSTPEKFVKFKCDKQQGPATTITWPSSDIDYVVCLHSNWPPGAREWIDRNRPSNYPTVYFVHGAERMGIKVVPTGHKGSEHPDTEWRFSFSLIELDLVHMWPSTVLKCYVLLKLLRNSIISHSPSLCHTLSSYHLKTLLFWLTEETGVEYWKFHSPVQCMVVALKKLLCWIECGYVPHYFVRSNNLFDNDVGTSRQTDLVIAIRAMVLEGPKCILRCESFIHWCREMNEACPRYSSYVLSERSSLHTTFACSLQSACQRLTNHSQTTDIISTVVNIIHVRHKLTALSMQYQDDSDVCDIILYMIDVLGGTSFSLMLSFCIRNELSNSTHFLLFRITERMLKRPKDNKFVQLKLANFYYQICHYKKAIAVLQKYTQKSNHHVKVPIDRLFTTTVTKMPEMASFDSPFNMYSKMVLPVAVFAYQEICVAPQALKFEMFKSGGCNSTMTERSISENRQIALVDPDVFVFYLQYLCYSKLNKQNHAQVALNNIRWIVKEENMLYRETALNILGHCYMERNQLWQATACFVKSLQVQCKFTIAPLHLALSIAKAVQQRRCITPSHT